MSDSTDGPSWPGPLPLEPVTEQRPQTNLRPSLSNLADVARARTDGIEGFVVTLLAVGVANALLVDPDKVTPIPGVWGSDIDGGRAIEQARTAAQDLVEAGDPRLPDGPVQLLVVLHAPDAHWAVFPLFVGRRPDSPAP